MANINFNDVNKAEEDLKLAYSDLIAFGKLFLPDDFMRSETPFFHYEVADALSNMLGPENVNFELAIALFTLDQYSWAVCVGDEFQIINGPKSPMPKAPPKTALYLELEEKAKATRPPTDPDKYIEKWLNFN